MTIYKKKLNNVKQTYTNTYLCLLCILFIILFFSIIYIIKYYKKNNTIDSYENKNNNITSLDIQDAILFPDTNKYRMNVHLILYSNNEPFDTTKRLTIESIYKYTQQNVIIHDYNLEKIKQKEWFHHIKDLPSIQRNGRRDGYYNSWKAFIIKDVYDKMKDGDILYYVDSSQYFPVGFNENIDKFCDIVNTKLCIAGSIGDDVKNNSYNCCDNIMVWNKIIPDKDNTEYLNKPHVLNAWFSFKKCDSNNNFINDWVYFSCYKDNEAIYPLLTYHHTADQSIFNILVVKYKLPIFYHKDIGHDLNKNKNLVLNIINNSTDTTKYFIYL
jgi:hypothetical protein